MQKLHEFSNGRAIFRWMCDVCECVYSLDVDDYEDDRSKEALRVNTEQLLARNGCGQIQRYSGLYIDLCGDCFTDLDTHIAKMYTALVAEAKSGFMVDDDDEEDEE